MISWASCQQALALRSEKLTAVKTGQLREQKATWNSSCSLGLFCFVLQPQLTAWHERLEVLGSWGPWKRPTGLGSLNSNSEHLGEPRVPRLCIKTRKKVNGCLAAHPTLITEVILCLAVSPDGSRQRGHGHMTTSWQLGYSDRLLENTTV